MLVHSLVMQKIMCQTNKSMLVTLDQDDEGKENRAKLTGHMSAFAGQYVLSHKPEQTPAQRPNVHAGIVMYRFGLWVYRGFCSWQTQVIV